jgi:DNA-binding SARP family transcriptional activator/Tfp pilus assembly protein PilF
MTIRLTTLGGLHVEIDDVEVDSLHGKRMRAALFVHIAIERRVPRASLTTIFWPERREDSARHALRQSLYDLRRVLGADSLEATVHEVRASSLVRTDAHAFVTALERGDPESAARLYAGPFLKGIHLVDQRAWESWVDGRRTSYARDFRRACRDWLESKRATGDLAGALEAAQRWVAPDPFDDEAQHRLIETLVESGERTEAIRQYETFARLLEPEGLRPLDDTVTLIDRVRPQATVGPARASAPLVTVPPGGPQAGIPDRSGPRLSGRRPTTVVRPAGLLVAGITALVLVATLWLILPGGTAHFRGSLVAEGAIAAGERIVIADFGGPPTDPGLGEVITEALRTDLLMTEIVRVLDPTDVREVLRRMQVPDDQPLTFDLAREVAIRDGAKAVLGGEIAQAGSGYVLTAALRSAESDRILAAFRETARGPEEVIPAIDRLSRQIRRRAGESLRSLDAAPPLARVTSASLGALRLYSEADRTFRRSNYPHAIALLEEALDLDPEFAMAWRLLAVTLGNAHWDRARELRAATRAYELRDRLRPRERYLAAAVYHHHVANDPGATVDAYRRVLDLNPDDYVALNNLGLAYRGFGDFDAAAQLFEQAVSRSDPPAAIYLNLALTRLLQDRPDLGRETIEALTDRYPDNLSAAEASFWVLFRQGDDAAAMARVEPFLSDAGRTPRERIWAHDRMARLDLWRGRIDDARNHLEAAELIARGAGAPYNTFAWRLSRAFTEVMVGEPDRGVRLLFQGIDEALHERIPPPERAYFLHASILAVANRPADAEAVLRSFETDVPHELHGADHDANESVRALIQLRLGDPDAAVRTLESLRAARRCRFCFARHLGWALRDAGRLDDAAAEWEVAIAGKDTSLDMGFQLAEQIWVLHRLPALYEQLGDTTRALHHYRRIVDLWADADAELQPRVELARARIAALEAS